MKISWYESDPTLSIKKKKLKKNVFHKFEVRRICWNQIETEALKMPLQLF